MADKIRLDVALTERGLVKTRAKARAAIMAGQVLVDGVKVDKAGVLVQPANHITLKETLPFVSRGGLKLQKAIKSFALNLEGRVVLDVGASTGGFTDCALQAGARLVYAVDVGYGQLAWQLRKDPRVVSMERTNIRHLARESITQGVPDFCCIDVAFISLKLVLPVVKELLAPPGEVVMLIKPQFEAGRKLVGKKGVVRDKDVHLQVVQGILTTSQDLGFAPVNLDFSPIRGPEGNIEYLLHGFFAGEGQTLQPQGVVELAHSYFMEKGQD